MAGEIVSIGPAAGAVEVIKYANSVNFYNAAGQAFGNGDTVLTLNIPNNTTGRKFLVRVNLTLDQLNPFTSYRMDVEDGSNGVVPCGSLRNWEAKSNGGAETGPFCFAAAFVYTHNSSSSNIALKLVNRSANILYLSTKATNLTVLEF